MPPRVSIRPHDEPPPWRMPVLKIGQHHGISLQIAFETLYIIFAHVYGFRLPAPYNYLFFFFHTVIKFPEVIYVDAMTSNWFGRNVENLRKAGFSDLQILLIMNSNCINSQLLGFLMMNYVCTDPEIFSLSYFYAHFNATMILRILASLALSETLFCAAHSLMHKNEFLAKYHVMHHCCVCPTWTTNLVFHPLDLSMEFGGPALGLLGLHFGVFQDQATFLLTYLIFQLWYAYDHEPYLNLYHIQHHQQCDSLYVIYTNFRGDPKHNRSRGVMQDMGLQWPSLHSKKST
ncbi:expressed unknown protein [Seminavis robusta]|uniref:Fatty acid hydroxylase domain-containing protein n=1 Tax=Seminavis robusta TaxID=568900 RepID=A0A9N8E4Q7_9STRA|nr:expressed unknown protein [Seminavis robusta]|eukprot:Sro649_g181260.1 n/a (289) ;mRNA; f:40911-41777